MKPPAQLQTVIELMALVEAEPRPSDGLLSAYFRGHRYIGSKDRSAIASKVYALLRHHARLRWWVAYLSKNNNKMPLPPGGVRGGNPEKTGNVVAGGEAVPPPAPPGGRGDVFQSRKLVLVYLRLVENKEAVEIAALFEGGKYAPARFDEEEKKLLAALKGRTFSHPGMPEDVRVECPTWAYEKLKTALGVDFEKEMQAMLREAPLDLRVNELKATREEALAALKKEKIECASTEISRLGIRVKGRPAVAQTKVFQDGWVEIQDEGSQMVALAAAPKPGMSVVDFCAGAGGKTLALAAMMNNKGRVVACDVLGGRLKRARERFKRAGLHNIEVRELSSEKDDWVKRNAGKHDVVLVDAPCSGTGVWRRNPDARWKNLGPGLAELTALQGRILQSASRLVKPGGKLLYATCSLLPEENEEQVEVFLKANNSFQRMADDLKLTPARHGTDGFYCAVLQKSTETKA